MTDSTPKGITSHTRVELPSPPLRGAVYCRVASDSPEQQTFIEEQKDYYTKKISDTTGDPLLPGMIQIARTELEHFTYNSAHLARTMSSGKRLPHGRRNPK